MCCLKSHENWTKRPYETSAILSRLEMELQLQVAQAVHVLNHDVQSLNRVAANQWLVQFQHSDSAWEVATSILTSDSANLHHDFEVELFAAQVLKRKIQSEGVNLLADSRSALQSALVISAKKFSTGPPQLLTQICLALSALVLRAVELKKPVEQLFTSLYELQGQGTGSSNAILELLTVLPEEVIEDQTVNVTVDSARRWQFTQELLSHTGAVLEFLLQQTKDNTIQSSLLHDRHRKVLRSLLSWVRVGCFLEIPETSVPSHPLLGFIYDSLQVSATFDLAIEVLTELVSRHEALPQILLSRMQSFREGLLLPAIANKNERIVGGLACLLAELGQAAPMLIAEGSPGAFDLTDALLRCVAYPSQDWEIADSTLNFWCSLAEFLLGLNTNGESQRKKTLTIFVPVYTALLDALFLRAKVEDYNVNALDRRSNLPDGLARFRQNLEELLTDICCFLGPTQFLAKLLSGTWITLESTIPWQKVEVRLFALNTVAEVVLEDEQPFDLSIIMHMMMTMNNNHIDAPPALMHLVHKSAAEVAGSFSKLLCPHATTVLPVLSFLASGLPIPVAASSCAAALRKICEEVPCIANEPGNLEGLLWIGEGLHSMHLSLREEEDIICAIGSILAAIGSQEVLNNSLKRVLKPSYEGIEALLKADSKVSLRQHSAEYVAILESGVRALTRLGLILSQLSVSNTSSQSGDDPVLDVLRHFWPLLESVLASRHMENNGLAAAVCRSLSYIIQASGQQFFTLLPEVMMALSQDFLSFQSNECFIRTAAVALEEFGHKEEFGSLFISTFSAFTTADVIFGMNSSYACDQEPDIAEAYMSFTSTFLCCCPKDVIMTAGSLIESSLRKATIWCTAMHRGAALAAMSYMSRFLEVCTSSVVDSGALIAEISLASVALSICSQCGESAVSGVLYALLGVSAMTRVHKAATILQQLATLCHLSEMTNWKPRLGWGSMQGWLVNAVQSIPSEYLKPGEAEQLVSSWLKALEVASSDYCSTLSSPGRTSADGFTQGHGGRSLKRIIREFADAHRHIAPTFASM